MSYVTSKNGIEFIKSFEGCVLKSYQDAAGVWTVGYGHTSGMHSGITITAIQAEMYLKSDLTATEHSVNKYVTITLSQNMFDALVSFTFNVGPTGLKKSTLLGKLNLGDIPGAANELDKWVYAGKKILPGLVRRRAAEKKMFLNGGNSENSAAIPSCTPPGNAVYLLQALLYWHGFNPGEIDGIYGSKTTTAVKAFQSVKGLAVDGIAGKNTMNALLNDENLFYKK